MIGLVNAEQEDNKGVVTSENRVAVSNGVKHYIVRYPNHDTYCRKKKKLPYPVLIPLIKLAEQNKKLQQHINVGSNGIAAHGKNQNEAHRLVDSSQPDKKKEGIKGG